jgi:hypothetical protein
MTIARTGPTVAFYVRNKTSHHAETNLAGSDRLSLHGRAVLGRRLWFIREFVEELIDELAGCYMDAGL